MNNPNKKRLRRTMMFLNAQKPGLIKDPYIYKPDSIMLDLEDAVAENQKDAARFSLYHALKTIDYRGCERVVRINGLDSPYWKEDIRCSVAGGCDSIRIPKTESAQDVQLVEREIISAEKEFGRPEGRPKLFWFNLILTLAVIVCLIFVKVPAYYVFMFGCAIALLVNFSGASQQNKIIKAHAGTAIMMSSTILCAGVFLGVMENTGIMNKMATVLAGFVPMSMGRFLPIIIGVLAVPLTLMFDTDSFFFGLMPVLIEIAGNFGVLPVHIAIVMVVCRNCATFISLVVPATFLGIGLADVEIKDHIKRCFPWIWGVSIVCLMAGMVLGVVKF